MNHNYLTAFGHSTREKYKQIRRFLVSVETFIHKEETVSKKKSDLIVCLHFSSISTIMTVFFSIKNDKTKP